MTAAVILGWGAAHTGPFFGLVLAVSMVAAVVATEFAFLLAALDQRFDLTARAWARLRRAPGWLDGNPWALGLGWVLLIGIGALSLIRWPS